VTSCPFRVMLGPFWAMLASWSKTLGLLGPQEPATCATWHTTASKHPKMLYDVMGDLGDIMGLPRPTSWWKEHNPSRSRPTRLPLVKRPPLSPVQSFDLSLPPAGVSTSIWWDFSPMEVRTNHLPRCTFPSGTCPSGVALQHQQIHPPWAHKS
jgi:hypothetical protein